MGTHNHDAVLAAWGELVTANARLALIEMARWARDPDTAHPGPPVYRKGWPQLAVALGRPKYAPADKTAVKRAVSELRRVGAITTVRRSAPHEDNAWYRLNIEK